MVQVSTPARNGTILVVEDRDDVRTGLAQLLSLHGFLVAGAADGEDALRQLRANPDAFALIVLDLLLPGALDGAALRAMQLADATLSPIPTIVITGTEPKADERWPLHPDEWLDKPFRFDDLLPLVKRYVSPG